MRNILSVLLIVLFASSCSSKKTESILNESISDNNDAYSFFLKEIKDSLNLYDSEIDKINFIRIKSTEVLNLGIGGRDIENIYKNWTELSGSEFYNLFDENKGTVKCGGTAHFLKNIYQDLGFQATTYDMGIPHKYTHQVVLVKNKDDSKYYIQDAYYNLSYLDKKGNALSFENLIQQLSKRESKNIYVQLDDKPFKFDTTGLFEITKYKGEEDNYDEAAKILLAKTRAEFYKGIVYAPIILNTLEQENLTNDPLYFYLLPLEHNSKEIMNLYKKLTEKK